MSELTRSRRLLVAALLLVLASHVPSGVRAHDCVRPYTPASPLLGAANAVIYPARGFLGGVFFSYTTCSRSWRCAPTIPIWIVGSALASLPGTLSRALRTVGDLATLGRANLTHASAQRLEFYPTIPFLVEGNPDGSHCPP